MTKQIPRRFWTIVWRDDLTPGAQITALRLLAQGITKPTWTDYLNAAGGSKATASRHRSQLLATQVFNEP